jgi:archaellum component FlaC
MANVKHNIILGMDAREFRKEIDNVQRNIRGVQQQFMKLTSVVVGFGATLEGLRMAGEFEKLGVEVSNVRNAFYSLNNPTLLDELRNSTRGLVSDLDLMKQAIKFENFNLPIERMAQYLAFAQKRAAETGESIDYLVNSIVVGLGRGSIKVLDNLQIDVQKFNELVKSGVTYADALSQVMAEDMVDGTELATSAVEELSITIENLKNQSAVALAPFIKDVIELVGYVGDLAQQWQRFMLLEDLWRNRKEGTSLPGNRQSLGAMIDAYKAEHGFSEITPPDGVSGELEKQKVVLNEVAHSARVWADAMQALDDTINDIMIGSFTSDVEGLNDAIWGAEEALNEINEEQLVDIPKKIEEATEAISYLGNIFQDIFYTALNAGEDFFSQMGKWIENFIKRMAAAAAAAAALNIISGGSLGTVGAIFGQLAGLGSLTKMAHGGIVDRPTPVIAGEAGPEAIIPLHKLGEMAGGGTLTARVSGRDLLFILEREQRAKDRTYG